MGGAGDIGPGDWVECLLSWPAQFGLQSVDRSCIYQISRIVLGNYMPCPLCQEAGDGWVLVGDRPDRNACHCPCQFRPIYRPKADFLESLLRTPDPARVPEVAHHATSIHCSGSPQAGSKRAVRFASWLGQRANGARPAIPSLTRPVQILCHELTRQSALTVGDLRQASLCSRFAPAPVVQGPAQGRLLQPIIEPIVCPLHLRASSAAPSRRDQQ